jgi:hypothetical protein
MPRCMKPDKRKPFTYLGVTVVPKEGESRYFGCVHGEYLRRYWRVLLGPMSYVLTGTKADARTFIRVYTGSKLS